MDSAEFLDLLGNANRRRILRLLSRKPCYVTEISEYLGVSPKAVIDHLRKLEEAGLVESRTDERRRKYFSISRHVRLEVTVSPYEFGTKSAYPASSALDITSWSRLTIELDEPDDVDDPDTATESGDVDPAEAADLARRLDEFERLDDELSMAQRWTQGRISRLRDQLAETVEAGDPRLLAELLVSLADGGAEIERLAGELEAPPPIVEDLLEDLAANGVVTRNGRRWELAEPP